MELTLAPDDEVACRDFTRGLKVDPGGTGIAADLVVAVDTPLPWPKPVFEHPLLAGVDEMADAATVPTKVLAMVPRRSRPPERIIAWQRTQDGAVRTEYGFTDDPRSVLEAVIAVSAQPSPPPGTSADDAGSDFEILLCTQGSHDTCCGSEGTRLAVELEAAGVTVHRVSHTGGHRFAPTGMSFPDGRTWAYLDTGFVGGLVAGTLDPAECRDRCRGWWGASAGPAQVAERAVWSTMASGTGDPATTVRPLSPAATSGPATEESAWEVGADGRRWEVGVRVARIVPTIACRQPGGLPAKPGHEYEVTHLIATD